jgi:hypothetical protein
LIFTHFLLKGFIDPLAIAEDIISVREEVALEWKEVMIEVELDHADIRTEIFRLQMAKWGQTVEPEKKEKREPVKKEVVEMAQPPSTNHIIIEAGDFE